MTKTEEEKTAVAELRIAIHILSESRYHFVGEEEQELIDLQNKLIEFRNRILDRLGWL